MADIAMAAEKSFSFPFSQASSSPKKSANQQLDISCHLFPELFPIREARLA
jgi:hypothetical protein